VRRLLPLLPFAILTGCPAPDGGAPVGQDVVCDPISERIELDADGPDPQAHPTAAWDGGALQVAWNGPRDPDSGQFAVRHTVLACDGAMQAVQVLDDGAATNNVDPAVAVSGDRVLVAWQADSGAEPYNLSIATRPLPLSGDPDRPWAPLEMRRADAPYAGNAWMPRLADDGGGGFVLAGSRGIDAVGRFQGFLQDLDVDGAPFGDSQDLALTFEVSQLEPAVAVAPDRTRIIGWEERPDEGDNRVVWRTVQPDGIGPGTEPEGLLAEQELGILERVGVAVEPTERGAVAMVAHGGSGALDVTLEVIDRGDGARGPRVLLGDGGAVDHTPGLVLGADGGAAIWHRQLSGLANELWVQPFRLEGEPVAEIALGEPVRIDAEADVAPYAPTLVSIGDGWWFVAWSETGTFRVAGRFVRLEVP